MKWKEDGSINYQGSTKKQIASLMYGIIMESEIEEVLVGHMVKTHTKKELLKIHRNNNLTDEEKRKLLKIDFSKIAEPIRGVVAPEAA